MARGLYQKAMDVGEESLEKFLGELELTIMEILWERNPATVREVREVLAEERELAYTTVMTVMSRLADKGLLSRKKEGRAYVYWPDKSRTELESSLAGQVVRALLEDFGEVAVSQFIHELEQVDRQSLDQLGELADEGEDEAEEEAE